MTCLWRCVRRCTTYKAPQAGSIFQRCTFQSYCLNEGCLEVLCVQVLCPARLVRREVSRTIVCHLKSCWHLVKRALTQNKHFCRYMCEITVFSFLLSILRNRLPGIVVKEFVLIGRIYLMCKLSQKYPKNNKFSCLNLIKFLHVFPPASNTSQDGLVETANKRY